MLRRLFSFVGEYRKIALWTPVGILGEVVLEIVIPYLMARRIDLGLIRKKAALTFKTGGDMVAPPLLSMRFARLA